MTSLAQVLGDLDPSDNLPLYQQLQRGLREAIEKRILGPDDALPSERQLAEDLGVSSLARCGRGFALRRARACGQPAGACLAAAAFDAAQHGTGETSESQGRRCRIVRRAARLSA